MSSGMGGLGGEESCFGVTRGRAWVRLVPIPYSRWLLHTIGAWVRKRR